MREFIANPNKIFKNETIFQKVGESVLKNMWGGKAEYSSSMLPEDSKMLRNTPYEGLNLLPLTSDLILKDKIDRYQIPKNGEEKIIKDEDEIRRIEAMKREYFEGVTGKKFPQRAEPNPLDDQVIPTMMNNKEMQEELKRLEDEELPRRYNLEAMDLDPETMALAQPMIPVFGMDIMKKLFSADWHLREEAIRDVEREVKLGSKSALCGKCSNEEIFSAAM